MRRVLVDWMIQVHSKFNLLPETLFITINLLDRFTQKSCEVPNSQGSCGILRREYQLIGVTCMLIAAKYEEIYPPYVKDFSLITDNAYTQEQITATERLIL
jgi:hypothetical protein